MGEQFYRPFAIHEERYALLEQEFRVLSDKCATLTRERDSLKRQLVNLTPGGSEFADNPDRCVKFLENERSSHIRLIVEKTAALNDAERERGEAIARLQWRAKNLSTRDSDGDIINWSEVEERWYRNWDAERQRADRAEAQLAEAQRALEIDRRALSAMQRDFNQSQREAERLRAMLRSLQWSITRQEGNTYWAHCPRCLKRMDHGHADDCPLAAALNPPAEVKDEKYPQPNP